MQLVTRTKSAPHGQFRLNRRFRAKTWSLALAIATSTATMALPSHARAEDKKVVRALDGNWGMAFTFGGLATMTAGNRTDAVGGLLVTQVSMRAVMSEKLIFPMFVGFGARVLKPDNTDASSDVGFRVGGGIEYHFRIWRRISPFVGGNIAISLAEPSGDSNWIFGLELMPTLGIEYYVFDRVSLIAQYFFAIQFQFTDNVFTFTNGTQTQAGGALSLVFYF
jgi:hypothetical protein